MRKFMLSGIAAGALFAASSAVHAADMPPAYKAPPKSVAAPLFNWTGFYVGADAGYLWSDSSTFIGAGGGGGPFLAEVDAKGFSGDGHVGYRHQFASGLVLGWEADGAWLNADGSAPYDNGAGVFGNLNLNWNASARGVLGHAADRSLFYLTGGAVWLDYDGCASLTAGGACLAGTTFGDTVVGWTAGAGLAYAFTPNLIVRAEYLYADYGSHTHTTPITASGTTVVDIQTHTVRGGVSWKFSTP